MPEISNPLVLKETIGYSGTLTEAQAQAILDAALAAAVSKLQEYTDTVGEPRGEILEG